MDTNDAARDLNPKMPARECKQKTCCSSPAAMCYWLTVSLAAWALLSFVGIFWRPLHGSRAATILLAAAIGCSANWLRNRTFHCGITAPLFFAAAALLFLASMRLIAIDPRFVWLCVGIGTGVSFALEWRYVVARHGKQDL